MRVHQLFVATVSTMALAFATACGSAGDGENTGVASDTITHGRHSASPTVPAAGQDDMQLGSDAPNLPSSALAPPVKSGAGLLTDSDPRDCFKVPLGLGDTLHVTLSV